MKILFICENYHPHRGGAEVVFQNLAERFAQRNNQVTVLTQQLPNTKKTERLNNTTIKRVYSFFSRYLFTFLAIPKAIKLANDLIKNKGRLLVRPSGTEPKIRIMCESFNYSLIDKCINIVKKTIH